MFIYELYHALAHSSLQNLEVKPLPSRNSLLHCLHFMYIHEHTSLGNWQLPHISSIAFVNILACN